MADEKTASPILFPGVMISSTFTDLKSHRKALIRALKPYGFTDVAMENDAAKPVDVLASSLQMVRDSAAYIGVISRKYGQIPKSLDLNPSNLSMTELEFNEAIRLGLPILLFLMDEKHRIIEADVETNSSKKKKLDAFRERAKKMGPDSDLHRVYGTFKSLADFKDQLGPSILGLKEHLEALAGPSAAQKARDPIPKPPALYAEPPYIVSHKFVGRRAELDTLSDWASASEPHPILLFEAIGGTGKSMLTWEWTTNHASNVRTDWAGRFWYSFYERGAVLADFCRRGLAYITGEPVETFKKQKTAELGQLLLHHLQARPWLFVLDGLERVLVAYHRIDAAQVADEEAGTGDPIGQRDPCSAIRPEDDDLLRSLAAATRSKVLITSRLLPHVLLNAARQPIPGVLHAPLRGLRPADAEELIRASGVRGNSEAIQSYLQKHCDCHPLVIGVLAGLVNEYFPDRGNFDAWAADPEEGGRLNLADLDLAQKRNHILKVALSALSEKSRELLAILAFLSEAVDNKTLAALNDELPPRELQEIIRDLERRGLLQYDRQARRYDLHPVVRGVASGGLGSEETKRYGQRVVDHFSEQAHSPYEQAETLEDLAVGLHVVRGLLRMGRLEAAYSAYRGDLSYALLFNLEAFSEVLALLRPFFEGGWDQFVEGLEDHAQSYLANEAAIALQKSGEPDRALDAYGASIRARLRQKFWPDLCTTLSNVGTLLRAQNRMARSEHQFALALDLATLIDDRESLFSFRLDNFFALASRGQWAEAEALWNLIQPMGRAWGRARYRPGDAESLHAWVKFWRGDLREEHLLEAERLAREGKSRATLRDLHGLRGDWRFEQGAWALAAESYEEAVRMAREVGQTDETSETRLSLAKYHLGQLAEPRQEAERLARLRRTAPRALAELWLAIGEKERAEEYALDAYKAAWADGEPYVWRYALDRSRELLEKLGVEVPDLPPYDPGRDEKLPWEEEVVAVIEALRTERASQNAKKE